MAEVRFVVYASVLCENFNFEFNQSRPHQDHKEFYFQVCTKQTRNEFLNPCVRQMVQRRRTNKMERSHGSTIFGITKLPCLAFFILFIWGKVLIFTPFGNHGDISGRQKWRLKNLSLASLIWRAFLFELSFSYCHDDYDDGLVSTLISYLFGITYFLHSMFILIFPHQQPRHGLTTE